MDLRIEKIFREEIEGDTSFQEKESGLGLFFGIKKLSNLAPKQIWDSGIKHGIEIGLRKASLEGQKIELSNNTTDENHKRFIEKFYSLADEYKCGIQYHPESGMVIVSRNS